VKYTRPITRDTTSQIQRWLLHISISITKMWGPDGRHNMWLLEISRLCSSVWIS